MKIEYRSASKLRRQASLLSRLYSATVRAAMALVCLTETTGLGHALLAAMAVSLAVVLAPVVGLFLLAMEIFPWAVHQAELLQQDEDGEDDGGLVEHRSSIKTTLDSSVDPGMVTVVATVAGPPDVSAVRRSAADWVTSGDRDHLKKTLGTRFGCYVWKTCPEFAIENHVTLSQREATEGTLMQLTTELCSQVLPRHLPPWQVIVVPLLQRSDAHVLVFRFHHLLAKFLDTFGITSVSGEPFRPLLSAPDLSPSCPPDRHASLTVQLKELATTLHLVFSLPLEMMRELLCPTPSVARLRPSPRGDKDLHVAAWSEAVPSALIDKMKEKSGATTHDILLTCICGALRHYITMTEGHIPDDILSILPVSLRPSKATPLGDEKVLGFLTVVLPLDEANILMRLSRLQRRLATVKKHSWKFRASVLTVQYLSRALPGPVAKLLVKTATRHCSVVITSQRLETHREGIDHLIYWRPPPANVGLSLWLLHYSNTITLAAVARCSALQRPDILVSCFAREVYDLAFVLGVRQERQTFCSVHR